MGERNLKVHWNNNGRVFCGTYTNGRGVRESILTKDPDAVTCKTCLRKARGQTFYNYDATKNRNKRITAKMVRDYRLPEPTKKAVREAAARGAKKKVEHYESLGRPLAFR